MIAYILTATLVVGYPLSVWWLWRQMHFDPTDTSAHQQPTTDSGPQRTTRDCIELAYPPWIEGPFPSSIGRLLAVAGVRNR